MVKNLQNGTWPNFFIIGAPKAGTTSIYNYLKNIPEIFMSPEKEPNYFSKKNIPDDHPIIPIRDILVLQFFTLHSRYLIQVR